MDSEEIKKRALEYHIGGKFSISSKVIMDSAQDLSLAYSPGVAEPCREIAKDKSLSYKYTSRGNMILVVSDGSAVLGLGNIGPEAAMPVMEGKALLFKKFGNVDAIPLVLDTQDTEKIIETVKLLAPSFGGVNIEDIAAPACFLIEERLKSELDIPVFHDDQHGTAMVVLAGLITSLKLVGKDKSARIVVNGAGAAGVAIVKLLGVYGFTDIVMCDSKGIVSIGREHLNDEKIEVAKVTNPLGLVGSLSDALVDADIFIGVSKGNLLNVEMVKSMADDSIIFAMANPDPEIMPELAREGGAKIIATGRSDLPNQINNVLIFPGLFRGVLDGKHKVISEGMKIACAEALAGVLRDDEISFEKVIADPFDSRVVKAVSETARDYKE